MVAGNNDVWIFKWFDNIYSDEDILWYVNAEKRSILVEMMQQLHMKCSKIEDVQVLKNAIEENFSEETEDKCVCHIPYLEKQMEIERDNIYTYKGREYCADFTTYCLPVEAGEIVSYCEKVKDGILIKRDGIVGKYTGKYEFVNGEQVATSFNIIQVKHCEKKGNVECIEVDDFKEILKYVVK